MPSTGLWIIKQFQCEQWWLVILTAWSLTLLLTFLLLHLTNSPLAQNAFICLYGLFLVMTISVLPQHHHLEKVSAKNCSSLFVSVLSLSSWIPVVMVTNFISIFGFHMSTYILLLNSLIYLSNLFINPIVYALRIPEFKEAWRLCCSVRREIKESEENTGRVNMAADHIIMYSSLSNIVEDLKLWPWRRKSLRSKPS